MRYFVLAAALAATAIAAFPGAAVAAGDRDRDGMKDSWERKHHVKSAKADVDRDGLKNRVEYQARTNPRKRDSDRDGRVDRFEDRDRDRVDNGTEVRARTAVHETDTDHDRKPDGMEDPDRDGLINAAEDATGNDPRDADTDGDGGSDLHEGAGQVVEVGNGWLTIALGNPAFSGQVGSPIAAIAQNGSRVTGVAVLPDALLCASEADYEGVFGTDAADNHAVEDDEEDSDDEDYEDEGDEEDYEDEESEEESDEYEADSSDEDEGDDENDEDTEEYTDECPAGALHVGAFVHEVYVDRESEGIPGGVEFEEIVIVR